MDQKATFPLIYLDSDLQMEVERLLNIEPKLNRISSIWPIDKIEITSWTAKNNKKYTTSIRPIEKKETSLSLFCALCKKNGETREKYTSHNLKDRDSRVMCPVLFSLTCKHCGATGYSSHTEAYCPTLRKTFISEQSDLPPVMGAILKNTKRNSTGLRR